MAESLVIDVDNKALLEALKRMPKGLQGDIARANLATGRAVVRGAQARAAVRFGFLRQSIDMKVSREGDVYVGIARGKKYPIPGTRTFSGRSQMAMPSKYAHLVERGTARSGASPFLWPAAMASESAHRRRLADAIEQAIQREGLGD